jgi:outer membrane protein OmpA-like peptidoglycan-associated protein
MINELAQFANLHGISLWLTRKPAGDYFFFAFQAVAWAEAFMAIGAAYATRMIPLRFMAMFGNIFGFTQGLAVGSLPTIVKHSVNFPLNAARAREMRRLIANVREANATDLNIEWLKPFMNPRSLRAGTRMFSKGDEASEAFILVEGRIEIPEHSVVLHSGDLFGEMALFSAEGRRTASAFCTTDVRLLFITYEQLEQLYFQNPEFGLYLVRLIVQRFEMNVKESPRLAAAAKKYESGGQVEGETFVPLAWVWSQFKGEFPQTTNERQSAWRAGRPLRTVAEQSKLFALGATLLVIGGLTWLLATGSDSSPKIAAASEHEVLPAPSGGSGDQSATISAAVKAHEDVAAVKVTNDVALDVPASAIERGLIFFLEQEPWKAAAFDLDRVSFDAGNVALTASSQEQLEHLAKILSRFPKARVAIGVHSDGGGNKAQNVKLSLERAKRVLNELVRMGIGKSRLTVKGNTKQRLPTHDKGGEARAKDGHPWLSITKMKDTSES